jgi:PAS domain S-box-containing protein
MSQAKTQTPSTIQLVAENGDLKRRLEEAEDALRAIRSGEVDAFVVGEFQASRVYTLETADRPYRAMIEQMHQGAALLGADGTILYGNTRLAEMFGRSSAEILGQPLAKFVSTHEHSRLDDAIRVGSQTAAQAEGVVRCADGSETPVLIVISALADGAIGPFAIVTDLTEQATRRCLEDEVRERRRAERALRQSEQRFRLAADASRALIYEADLAADLIEAVHGPELLGHGDAQFPAKLSWWLDQIHPDDVAPRHDALVGGASSVAALVLEYRIRHRDGRYLSVQDIASVMFDADGRAARIVGGIIDISERKAAEAALRDADRRKDEFLAMLGHELRNPLAGILGAVQVLEQTGAPDDATRDMRQVISRQAKLMQRLIDDLLDVSRIARGKIPLQKAPIELGRLVLEAVSDHAQDARENQLQLRVNVNEEPVWCNGDAERLRQVLSNLLHNACKFTDTGGAIDVELRVDPSAAIAILEIRDTGIGMNADTIKHLFEPFVQADNSFERSRGGLGLGLALVRGLIEMHGGHVTASSLGVGCGSSFVIRLPICAPPSAIGAGNLTTRSRIQPSLRILVVDDRRDASFPIMKLLQLDGHDVQIATDGPTGIELAQRFRPQVVLCDIGLPGMSGYDVARAFRVDAKLAGAYLIAATGYGQDEDRRAAADAGFDHHLTKPVDITTLRAVLARCLQSTQSK